MTLIDIIDTYADLIGGPIVSVLISAALLVFVFNVIRYFIVESGNDKGREKARRYIVWSILALTVIITIWGIVSLLLEILGLSVNGTLTEPTAPTPDYQGWYYVPSDCSNGGPC